MIKIKNLVHEYIRRDENDEVTDITKAIDGVNIEVKKGQFVAILGHNGSGKSTLAKHINALLYPGEGSVVVDGKDTQDTENIWEIRQSAGMVFQNPDNQIIASVVEEDVGFGPENLGVAPEEIWQRVEDSLKSVGMWKYRKDSPNKLSGGQKQRVAIAGIMAMHPKCIILDEATAMLDPKGRLEVMESVKNLNEVEKITILHITHYMEEVIYADHVIVMDHGKVVMEGTPKEIFSRVEDLCRLHLEVPQITMLAYELKKAGVPLKSGILTEEEFIKELQAVKVV